MLSLSVCSAVLHVENRGAEHSCTMGSPIMPDELSSVHDFGATIIITYFTEYTKVNSIDAHVLPLGAHQSPLLLLSCSVHFETFQYATYTLSIRSVTIHL